MSAALLIRLRPSGPLRIGPDSGVRDRVDRVFHSDSLYSAVSQAMLQLGMLDEWLEATVRITPPAVRFSSCFPYLGDTLLVTPPKHLWPPQASSKVRWNGARFVPVSVVESLAAGQPLREDQWTVDAESECLLPNRVPPVTGPYRVAVRSNAAVDRSGEAVAPHASACMEFAPNAGLWTVAEFADDAARVRWTDRLAAAFRLLADTGIGGERSRGWGRFEAPSITEGKLPGLLFKRSGATSGGFGYWLLSLYHPALTDVIDWQQGDYSVVTRGGRVESQAGWGQGKQNTRMVTEGSVLVSSEPPCGSTPDVAPVGFAHPVYRSGYALAIPIPLKPADRTPKPEVTAAPIIVSKPVVVPETSPQPAEPEVEERGSEESGSDAHVGQQQQAEESNTQAQDNSSEPPNSSSDAQNSSSDVHVGEPEQAAVPVTETDSRVEAQPTEVPDPAEPGPGPEVSE